MSNKLEFSLAFKRQYKAPLDPDTTFATLDEMTAYLSSGNKFAGQIVSCVETDMIYVLNSEENEFIPVYDEASPVNVQRLFLAEGDKLILSGGSIEEEE